VFRGDNDDICMIILVGFTKEGLLRNYVEAIILPRFLVFLLRVFCLGGCEAFMRLMDL
jgi:hypothetical protein